MMRMFVAGAIMLWTSTVAFGQTVQQSGPVVAGHTAVWQWNGIIADGGGVIGAPCSVFGTTAGTCAQGNSTTTFGPQAVPLNGSADVQGNGPKVQLSTGTTGIGHTVIYDANGNTIDSGVALSTPANTCGAPTNDSTDASTAINNCIALATANGTAHVFDLVIDQPYSVAAQIQLQSNLTLRFVGNGRIDQNFTPAGVGGVVSQANRTGGAISNVAIYNLKVQGDCTYTLGGNLVSLWLAQSVVYSPVVNCFKGRSYLVNSQNTTWYNVQAYQPNPNSGAGGFRQGICQNSFVIGGYIDSGDDTWQFVPGAGTTLDTFNCGYIGVGGTSATARAFVIAPGSSNRSITDVSYSSSGGGMSAPVGTPNPVGNGNGISIGNGGTGTVTNITIGPAVINESNDYFQQQALDLSGSASAPLGLVTFRNVRVISPFKRCFNGGPYTKYLIVDNVICQKPHINLIGQVASTASAGATTITVPAYLCSLMQTNDVMEIVLDDSAPTNGSYAGRAQNFSTTSCSGTTLTVGALLGQASIGANIYDYTDSFQPTTSTVTSGNNCLTFLGVGIYNASDSVALAYDDGTALSTTILSVNGSTNTVCLNANLTKTSSAGAIFADRSYQGYKGNVFEGVQTGKISNSVFYGANNNVISTGTQGEGNAQNTLDSDIVFDSDTIKDIAPSMNGYQRSFCDHCIVRDGQLFATAGASPSAVSDTTAAPSFTTTISGNMTNNQTTVQLASATALPYYKHGAYILIDSEAMFAQGFGNATLSGVQRGVLGTSAATHTSGATVSIYQASVTESPIEGIDIGDFGDTFCGAAVGTYAIGQGNWYTGWKGCEAQVKITSAAAFPYTDLFASPNGTDTWRVSGSTNPTSLLLPSPPPFRSARIDFYDQGGSNLTMPNTATFVQCGGASFTQHSGNTVGYRFDATIQTLVPICANTP